MKRKWLCLCMAGTAIASLTALQRLQAGELTPPAGPIASTNRTTISPQTITTLPITLSGAGAYVLLGNLDATALPGGPGAIVISHDNVSLDLNGFSILGGASGGDGIAVNAGISNFRIFGGTVRNWTGNGINAGSAFNGCLDDLHLLGNAIGLSAGANAKITHCMANANTSSGLGGGSNCNVSNCVATENGTGAGLGAGFTFGAGCTIVNCNANSNGSGAGGGVGFNIAVNCTIQGCIAVGNGAGGGGNGISVGGGCTVANCTANGNGAGTSGGNGINAGSDCLIRQCSVNTNGNAAAGNRHGISAGIGSTVADCRVTGNFGDGVRVTSRAYVLNNNCVSNGSGAGDGAGVHATLTSNRIEGNSAISNDRGIDVDNASNLVIRNSARGNTTNYDVAAGNSVGPTVTSADIATSSNPHANYDF